MWAGLALLALGQLVVGWQSGHANNLHAAPKPKLGAENHTLPLSSMSQRLAGAALDEGFSKIVIMGFLYSSRATFSVRKVTMHRLRVPEG